MVTSLDHSFTLKHLRQDVTTLPRLFLNSFCSSRMTSHVCSSSYPSSQRAELQDWVVRHGLCFIFSMKQMECLEWCPHQASAVLGAIQWGPVGLVLCGGDSRPLWVGLPQGLSFVLASLRWGMAQILAGLPLLFPGLESARANRVRTFLIPQLHLLWPLACVPFFPWIAVLGRHAPWIDRQNL